jgi:leader peptidase (prepilin peptidase)/N-methyltransferase
MSAFQLLEANPASFVVMAGLLGLIVGSFLNVVIFRLPLMLEQQWRSQCADLLGLPEPAPAAAKPFNLLVPRSHCRQCGHTITALENIPVLSYLFLRGRCSACGTSISLRYPLVEILSGTLAATTAWHFGFGFQACTALVLTCTLMALSFIDLDHQLLPDAITLPCLWLGLTLNLFGLYTTTQASVLGAIAGYGVLWLVYHLFRLVTGKEGMGYGDFKLMAMLGAWLGWQALPAIILLSSLVGALVGIALILLKRQDRHHPIPFGPYISLAGWVVLLWGEALTDGYLRWVGFPS